MVKLGVGLPAGTRNIAHWCSMPLRAGGGEAAAPTTLPGPSQRCPNALTHTGGKICPALDGGRETHTT